jgi:hypothetical protein
LPAILTSDGIKDLIQSLPEVSVWKDLTDVFDRNGGAPHPDWHLPIAACQAAGGKSTDAVAAAYHLVQRYQQAWRLLEKLTLPVPESTAQILNNYGKTLSELLSLGGVDIDLTSLRNEPLSGSTDEGE